MARGELPGVLSRSSFRQSHAVNSMIPHDPLKAETPRRAGRPHAKGPQELAPKLAPRRSLGRPPKFSGPSRPVTVTLPETTLDGLKTIHPDCGQAIVKLTDAELRRTRTGPGLPLVEIVEMAANIGLILVGPSKALRRVPFLHLIQVADDRFLLALDPGHVLSDLEIAIRDLLEEFTKAEAMERELLQTLLAAIKQVRKAERISMAEILFVKPDENP